jgi:NAD(P)H-flavin reductase
MEQGQRMGIRGPLGNSWPIEFLEGKNAVIVGGGFAFTTLRSLLNYMIVPEHRDRFGKITVVYGARNPGLLLYKDELAEWAERDDVELHVTVDQGDESWTGREGFVPTVCKEVAPSSENAVCLLCGPPIMIRFTLPVFFELGFSKENIVTSLEMRMKCGVGKCGRCNVGPKYVCKDGPVFSLAEVDRLSTEY